MVFSHLYESQLMCNSNSNVSFFTLAWNLVQTELTCCGVNSPTDWHQSKSKQRPFLPESCCKAVEVSSMCRIDNETFGPYEKVIY